MPMDYKEEKKVNVSEVDSSQNKVKVVEKHKMSDLSHAGEQGVVHSPLVYDKSSGDD